MLYYDKIDTSETIDFLKSNNSKNCMIYHCCFFNHGFNFQYYVCNDYHNLTMLIVNIKDFAVITVITVKNVDCPWIIYNISKSEAISLLKNSVLEDRGYLLKNIVLEFSLFKAVFYYLFCLVCV